MQKQLTDAKTTDFRYKFCALLAEARKRRGLTQQEVADLLGINRCNLSRIEKGKYVSIDAIGRYLEAIGAEVHIN